jgi:hypothetical protein
MGNEMEQQKKNRNYKDGVFRSLLGVIGTVYKIKKQDADCKLQM